MNKIKTISLPLSLADRIAACAYEGLAEENPQDQKTLNKAFVLGHTVSALTNLRNAMKAQDVEDPDVENVYLSVDLVRYTLRPCVAKYREGPVRDYYLEEIDRLLKEAGDVITD